MEILIILGVIIAIILVASIKIVNQAEVYVIERLGKFSRVARPGLTIIIPVIDKVRAVVSLKKQIMDIKPQEVITVDNVSIAIDTVVFYQIVDPVMAIYEIESLSLGIENLAVSAMRDVIGKMELDETFSSRDKINIFLYNTHLDKIDEILQKLDGKYKIIKENKTFYGKMYLLSK